MIHIFENIGHEAGILLALAVILCAGFLVTRLTKLLHLPNVSGYIIAGILIGPHLLNVIPAEIADAMNFVADIALAFIAFGVGKFFKREVLRATGMRVVVITVMEALLAGVLVTAAMVFLFHFDWKLSLLLGAIATATAPASTVMTINQYHARGAFVNTLLQVVALDDVVCLLVFSIAAAVVNAADTGVFTAMSIVLPLLYNLAAIVLGAALAFVLAKLLRPGRSNDNRLILVIAMLLGLSGLCALFDISPLLSCMVFGAVYINKTDDRELYHQLNNFTPPIMSIFFYHLRHEAGRPHALRVRARGRRVLRHPHPREVRGRDPRLHGDARRPGNAALSGSGACAAGGRRDRSGVPRRTHPAAAYRRTACDHYSLLECTL